MTDMPPMVKWTAAVIAGGGVAGLTRGLSGVLRAHSTVLTGGLGNFVISTAELGGAALISFLALAAPLAAIALVALLLVHGDPIAPPVASRRQTIGRTGIGRSDTVRWLEMLGESAWREGRSAPRRVAKIEISRPTVQHANKMLLNQKFDVIYSPCQKLVFQMRPTDLNAERRPRSRAGR